jgi:hypothetical protein
MASSGGQFGSNNRLAIFWLRTSNRIKVVSGGAGVHDAIDDELHFFASSLQARGDAESDQSLFGAIHVCVRRSIPIVDSLVNTFAQKPADQTLRADIKINAIRVNLRADKDRARKVVEPPGRQMFPGRGEPCRRVAQPFQHWRIASRISDCIQHFDGIGQESAQAADDKGFEIRCRDPLTSGAVCRGAGDEALGYVIAIPRSLLDRVGRGHGFGTGIEDDAGQQAWFEGFVAFTPLRPVLFKVALRPSPQLFVDDRCVFSQKRFTLVGNLAPVDSVPQHEVQRPARKLLAAIGASIRSRAAFAYDTPSTEIISQGAHRPKFKITSKDMAHGVCFRFVDDKFAFLDVVAERGLPAHPHTLPFRRGDLVADSLSRDLALELGEGEQYVEREATHA